MRVPSGAPVPFWLSLRNRVPLLKRTFRPTLGSVAVVTTLVVTGLAVYAVCVYPKVNNDYYKRVQAEERAMIHASREELAHGQPVWVDPFKLHEEVVEGEGGAVQRNAFDMSEFADDDECVDLTHTRADHIPELGRFTALKELTMRNNLLTAIGASLLHGAQLTILDLYENQITKIENLENLVNLKTLDLSHNRIREIEGLEKLTQLTQVYFVHNKISEIKGLSALVNLELLELGDNRIKKIENLSNLKNLQELYLGKNKIRQLEGLENLTNLKTLSVPGNRLVKLENIAHLENVTEVYFSNQGLNDISELANLKKLEIVDIADNELETIDSLKDMEELTDIWANHNKISSWAEVDKLATLSKLDTIYLEHNPLYKEGQAAYRRKVMLALPQVKQIDATVART